MKLFRELRACVVCTCLLRLCLKGGGQHLWEELQEDWEKELHKRNNDKDHEGHQTEEVSTGPHQLQTETNADSHILYLHTLGTPPKKNLFCVSFLDKHFSGLRCIHVYMMMFVF